MSKVFGIGLSKTGTSSLAEALKKLDYKVIQYEFAPLDKIIESRLEPEDMLVDAATDITAAVNFEHLDKIFPGSRFIFTEREMGSWLKSCSVFNKEIMEKRFKKKPPTRMEDKITVKIQDEIFMKIYGTSYFEESKFIWAYHRHKKRVREYFKNRPEDILVFNVVAGDDWKKLCNFLNKSIPDTRFPNLNPHKGFKKG